MTIDQMREKLKLVLTEKRFNHSIGVMQTAVSLARHYGANVEKEKVSFTERNVKWIKSITKNPMKRKIKNSPSKRAEYGPYRL